MKWKQLRLQNLIKFLNHISVLDHVEIMYSIETCISKYHYKYCTNSGLTVRSKVHRDLE